MSKEDIILTDLEITGKRGPFRIKMLEYDEAMETLFNTKPDDKAPLMLRMAQACLVNGSGKPVYGPDQLDKMKKDIRPAATLMAIGLQAYKLNEMDKLIELGSKVETAVKN